MRAVLPFEQWCDETSTREKKVLCGGRLLLLSTLVRRPNRWTNGEQSRRSLRFNETLVERTVKPLVEEGLWSLGESICCCALGL